MRKTTNQRGTIAGAFIIAILVFSVFTVLRLTTATPYGPVLDYNNTETPGTSTSGLMLNHTKGKITTLRLNVSSPNTDWKGYVGNISGVLVLDDTNNYTLFKWNVTTVSGEIYATRNSGAINWGNIVCANSGNVSAEETAMGIGGSEDDSISNTFDDGNHPEFYVGTTQFTANQCTYSAYMYVNDQPQSSVFSEVLLSDGNYIIYTGILTNNQAGFDNNQYDFEMIVAENGGISSNQAYYFYVELGS